MVENDLGITFLFGNDWKINPDKVQLIPVYGPDGEAVSRNVWMMISEKCFKSQDIMDFISLVEKFYHVNE